MKVIKDINEMFIIFNIDFVLLLEYNLTDVKTFVK